jgi:hypothetical protein
MIHPKPVAYACNSSYSGNRYQEDHSSKPAPVTSLGGPILENLFTKSWVGGVAQGEGPEYCKK